MSGRNGFSLIETAMTAIIVALCAIVIIELRANSAHLSNVSKERSVFLSKISILIGKSKNIDSGNQSLKDFFSSNFGTQDDEIKEFFSKPDCSIRSEENNITVTNYQNIPILQVNSNIISAIGRETTLYRLYLPKK